MSVHRFFEIPHDNRPDAMLNLTVYADESQHKGPGHAVIAGFCGGEEQWNGLPPDWKVALGGRKRLHMRSLHWNGETGKRRIKPLLERLGHVPYKNGLLPLYGAIKISDYLDLMQGKPDFEKKLCGYLICLSVIFSALNKIFKGDVKIKIVCEKQKEYEPLAQALFSSFRQMVGKDPANPYFSGLEFIQKDDSILTQPADFLAFAMGKYLDERGGKKDLWCRPIFNGKDPKTVPGHVYPKEQARKKMTEIIRRVEKHRSEYLFS
jgi:hypothetical protein